MISQQRLLSKLKFRGEKSVSKTKQQWCVKCLKFHKFATRNWKYNWKQGTWECLQGEKVQK